MRLHAAKPSNAPRQAVACCKTVAHSSSPSTARSIASIWPQELPVEAQHVHPPRLWLWLRQFEFFRRLIAARRRLDESVHARLNRLRYPPAYGVKQAEEREELPVGHEMLTSSFVSSSQQASAGSGCPSPASTCASAIRCAAAPEIGWKPTVVHATIRPLYCVASKPPASADLEIGS